MKVKIQWKAMDVKHPRTSEDCLFYKANLDEFKIGKLIGNGIIKTENGDVFTKKELTHWIYLNDLTIPEVK